MHSGLGQRMAWYIVMNILENHSGCVHMPLEDTGRMPSPKSQYPQMSLYCSIILKTKHLNLNILLFPCIVSLFITNQQHAYTVLGKKVLIILHYISISADLSRSNVMYTKKI